MLPDMRHTRDCPGVAAVDGRIFVMGGNSKHANVEVFDLCTDTWVADHGIPPMPVPLFDFGVVVVGQRILCIGGSSKTSYHNTVQALDIERRKWSLLAPMPTKRQGFATVVIDNEVWCFGGYAHHDLAVIEVYNIDKNEWRSSNHETPGTRSSCRGINVNGKAWLIGGRDLTHNHTTSVDIFDPESGWSHGPPLPEPRSWHGAVGF
jgi:N-acetylneuraminic acid mutarotase